MKRGDATATRVANAIYYTCCLVALCWIVAGGIVAGGITTSAAVKVPELFALLAAGPALIIWFVGRLCSWALVPPVRLDRLSNHHLARRLNSRELKSR